MMTNLGVRQTKPTGTPTSETRVTLLDQKLEALSLTATKDEGTELHFALAVEIKAAMPSMRPQAVLA